MMDDGRDEDLVEAYRRLSQPVSSAGDPVPAVMARVRRRRMVRRAAAATAAAVAVVGVLGAVALRSGDEVAAVDDPQETGPMSTLTIGLSDGSTYTFPAADLSVTCGPNPYGNGQVVRVTTGEPQLSDDAGGSDGVLLAPVFDFQLRLDMVSAPKSWRLPQENPATGMQAELAPGSGSVDQELLVFFATPEGDAPADEVSSQMEGSRGTVDVTEATCGAAPSVAFDVDATLASEDEQQDDPRSITGSFRS